MTGYVTITSNPSGAIVYVDEMPATTTGNIMKTPVKVELDNGDHGIRLSMTGYCPDHDHVYVYPGAELMYHRDLRLCY